MLTQPAAPPSQREAPSMEVVRRAARRALYHELATYPKPGLVSFVDNGSHDDMDAHTFMRSAQALDAYFRSIASAGQGDSEFAALRALGVEAETRMLEATGGINTHRGAIFAMGLLCAAALLPHMAGVPLGRRVAQRWGHEIAHHRRAPASHGACAQRVHGAGGARAQAASGFPALYGVALPAYREALAREATVDAARVQSFFALMAVLDDTNLLHRGGAAGLAFAQREARRFLDGGGVLRAGWFDAATQLHKAFRARRLSPGGSADLLSACLLVDALEH